MLHLNTCIHNFRSKGAKVGLKIKLRHCSVHHMAVEYFVVKVTDFILDTQKIPILIKFYL